MRGRTAAQSPARVAAALRPPARTRAFIAAALAFQAVRRVEAALARGSARFPAKIVVIGEPAALWVLVAAEICRVSAKRLRIARRRAHRAYAQLR